MKTARKIFCLMMAVMMVMALCVTANAEDPETGTITVNGTVEGKTYNLYKIFDLAYADNGSSQMASYTLDADWVNFFITTPGSTYLTTKDTTGKLARIDVSGTVKYLNLTESNIAKFAGDAMAYAVALTPDASEEASDTTLVFDELDLGYYLIYPQGATNAIDSNGSICSIDNTMPTASVNVKATYPELNVEKETVTDTSKGVEIGQTIEFKITSQVPDTTGYTYYDWSCGDTMENGLTLIPSTIKVMFGTSNVTSKGTITSDDHGFTLYYEMTQFQTSTYKNKPITVTYSAIVNEDAVTEGTNNTVTMEYSNNPSDPSEHAGPEEGPGSVANTWTNSIIVDKCNAKTTSEKLQGAEFVLQDKTTGKYYQYTEAVGSTPAAVTWVADQADATVMTTDENGAASFIGLKDGTYKLTETKAPAGYNMLGAPVEITVAGEIVDTDTGAKEGQSLTQQVTNSAGTVLPSTGGIGTTLFYIIGGILLVGAFVLIVSKRRMAQNS